MNKLDFIHVGTFGSPVGLKGEIKVKFLTSSFEFFKNLNEYLDETFSKFYFFNNMRLVNKKLIVHPKYCLTREDAYNLKNKKIYSKSNNFPKTSEDQYYIKDIIGCSIYLINGENIGDVISVDNFGAGDLLQVKINNKNIYIPMNKDNLISINLDLKKIIVNPIKGIID